ncbi:hypothetical protein F9K50_03340 [bacterium]|nr:MAG: hypothetical protein F9K50_03340 [bacterium]
MQIRSFLVRLFLAAALAGCAVSNPNPATAPAPLAELPLRFPEEIGGQFEITTVADAGTAANIKNFVNEGDDISGQIADAALNASFTATLIDDILRPLHALVIPRRVDVTTFQDVIVFADQLVQVKIDFSHYPNRQGIQCSGHTASVPICYRIWFNGKRTLSGFFIQSIPNDSNSGDGFIQGLSPVTLIGAPFVQSVAYDLRDPTQRHADFFLGAMEINSPPIEEIPEEVSSFSATVHLTLDQIGLPEVALKTINASTRSFFDGKVEEEQRHVARWREGDDYWSGTADFAPLDDYSEFGEFFAACARISSGLVVNSSFCEERGLDVAEIDFLEFLKIGDLAFPGDFPTSPTF